MTRFEIKGDVVISESLHNVDVFEIVDKIPTNFFVWNIGENMGHDEYVPLCQRLNPGADKNDCEYYTINRNTLKTIKLPIEEVKLLRNASNWGICSKVDAEKALKSKKKGYASDRKRYHAEKTIEIFNRITA